MLCLTFQCIDDKESVADAASVASLEQQVASMGQQASSSASVADQKNTLAAQRQEIEQLREQRALLQKIVSQEKQVSVIFMQIWLGWATFQ